MEIKFGLISSDSHGQLGKDAYTSRMSEQKWGEKIPHLVEVREDKFPFPVERWMVNGEIQGGNVCNCPTAMKERSYYPQRWDEVPLEVYKRWIETGSMPKFCFPTDRVALSSTATRSSSLTASGPITTRSPNFAG